MAPINRITEEDLNAFANNASLNKYQQVATKSAFYPGQGTPIGLAYCTLKLNGESGELAEHVGKAMRDDKMIVDFGNIGGALAQLDDAEEEIDRTLIPGYNHTIFFAMLTPARKELITKEVGDVLWYLSAICNELGISLAGAAMQNLSKLKDRTDRDALRGSGDER